MSKKNKDIVEELKEEALKDQQSNTDKEELNSDTSSEMDSFEEESEHHEDIGLPQPSCEEELALYKDKHLRMYSDFENFRRRSAKERIELMQNAGQEIITSLLPILDDFDRAMIAAEKSSDMETLKEGMGLIHSKIYTLLASKGLNPMEATGKDFNSDDYEAIAKIPAPSKELKGKVLDVVEKGYYLNSKIIRHAKVVVGE